ncbi:MAG: hypothetical protein JWN70_518, partial [Planctomycetaceae bacterium]|nr:hypothetical protein [Planctomycetaceae bacterium]
MLINHYLQRFVALSMLTWTICFTTQVRAEDAAKPAAKSEAPVEEDAPADEPVETLKKKTDKPEAADSKPKPAADKKEASDKTDPPAAKPKASVADQLLEGLGLDGDAATGNPLDTIVERMRDVQGRLQKTETDKETRQLQTQIVKDLDDLIDKLKNQKPPPQSPNQNQSPPPPMGENSPDTPPRGSGGQPKPQNSQKQKGGAQEKPSPGDKKQQDAKS